jgi:leucine dehydrogenase
MMLSNNNIVQAIHPASSDNDPFSLASSLGFGDVHFKVDEASGLKAIIAIHNTNLGPALGGCRFAAYPSTNDALTDALKLARAMSYKAAMAGLPLGGGKAVIIRPEYFKNRQVLFEAYGRFIDELGGRFISSVDSGTGVGDMDAAARHTKFVRSTSADGDPSPWTAMGVRRGIQAAVKHKLKRDNLDGLHIAIQGAGHVGYPLAKELHALGARLTMCDMDQVATQRCADEFGAVIVKPERIFQIKADVFAPCALGGVINDETARTLEVKIVAGATNNPLASIEHAMVLHQRGILYAPDYVINAGGLMQVWLRKGDELSDKVNNIYDSLLRTFEYAEQTSQSPAVVVDQMAEKILYGPKPQ